MTSQFYLDLPKHADGPHINLPGIFSLTLEMKILDDIVVIMCDLLAAAACLPSIALSVDSMGDQFCPVMHAGWLSYIRNNYPDGGATDGPALGEGTLVVEDNP